MSRQKQETQPNINILGKRAIVYTNPQENTTLFLLLLSCPKTRFFDFDRKIK